MLLEKICKFSCKLNSNKQNSDTAITTNNISNQSVKYASSAGSAVDQTARDIANSKVSCGSFTSSGTLNAIAYSGTCVYYVIGKICIFYANFQYTSNFTPSDTQVIFNGLPKAKKSFSFVAQQYLGTHNDTLKTGSVPFRMVITTDGKLCNWYSSITTIANNPAEVSGCYPIA